MRKKLEAPGPEEEAKRTFAEPPDLKKRSPTHEAKEAKEAKEAPRNSNSRPNWWNKMYNRSAKNIPSHTWSDLMMEPSIGEILTTIKKIPDKAAGYDGVEINLIKLLTEEKDSPLTIILSRLFKVAFTEGATLPSWRRSVITMIPKRKEDGSWTDKVKDMRPISVLQDWQNSSKNTGRKMGKNSTGTSSNSEQCTKSIPKRRLCATMHLNRSQYLRRLPGQKRQ